MMKRVIIGIAILAGIAITIKDYRAWMHVEWDKYGQGYPDTRESAKALPNLYENKWAGIRLKYPGEWKVTSERQITGPQDSFGNNTVLNQILEAAKWDGNMRMTAERVGNNLSDIATREKIDIDKTGALLREPEGLELETADGLIFTWKEGLTGKAIIYQEAMVKRGDKLLRILITTPEEKWNGWEKTNLEIFKSIVVY